MNVVMRTFPKDGSEMLERIPLGAFGSREDAERFCKVIVGGFAHSGWEPQQGYWWGRNPDGTIARLDD